MLFIWTGQNSEPIFGIIYKQSDKELYFKKTVPECNCYTSTLCEDLVPTNTNGQGRNGGEGDLIVLFLLCSKLISFTLSERKASVTE